jgi:hypothetical protein
LGKLIAVVRQLPEYWSFEYPGSSQGIAEEYKNLEVIIPLFQHRMIS